MGSCPLDGLVDVLGATKGIGCGLNDVPIAYGDSVQIRVVDSVRVSQVYPQSELIHVKIRRNPLQKSFLTKKHKLRTHIPNVIDSLRSHVGKVSFCEPCGPVLLHAATDLDWSQLL